MKQIIIISILILLYSFNVNSQTTITLQPDATEGKDAFLHSLSSEANRNYGSNPQLAANAWTFGSNTGIIRSVVDFDFSKIPNGAIIQSANLTLYAWDSSNGFGQHSTLSGSNECWIQRITSDWNENTVTWNNQPMTTTTNQVPILASTYPSQNFHNIDVSKMVQDMINSPSTSFGFLIRLQNESYYRRMNFASSDHNNESLHPKLVICYTKTTDTENSLKQDFEFNLFPNPATNSFTLKIDNSQQEPVFLQIINSNGEIIDQKNNIQSTLSIDVSNYSKGIYFVKIHSNQFVSTKKLIIK